MTEASTFTGREHGAMAIDVEGAEVKAAGGVVHRRGPAGPEVAVVHRPKYDDWSLPKGKLDAGESWEAAALREAEEEIGLRCRLGDELSPVTYRDNRDRVKVVRYWLMEPDGTPGPFEPDHEVDDLRWLALDDAAGTLSYDIDRGVLREAGGRLGA
jgi:8-oxo-dGTP diphosphatase